jgi:GAF domain-containing protein
MPNRMLHMPDLTALQRICGLLDRGEIELAQFLNQFARRMVEDIGCSRAGVRMLIHTQNGPALRGTGLVDVAGVAVRVPDMTGLAAAPYFEMLLRDGCVVSSDCLHDAVTAAFVPTYLAPQDVRSLLDVSFSVNGVLYGTFSCEQVGETQAWSPYQLALLRQIASRVSLTLMHKITAHIDTTPGALWEPSTPNRLMTMPMALDGESTEP